MTNRELMNEDYRPQYHFTPESNWMNDPNGLVFFENEWHLFHQHTPAGCEGSHWGHAVSTDLLHWTHMPVALWPHDDVIIASGSAVVDWNNKSGLFDGKPGLVAIYTHWIRQNQPDSDQSQSIAYSKDHGRTWAMYEGNPVLPNQGVRDFRDPKVFWHRDTARWVMVAATFDCVTLYTSTNLIDWTYASTFGKGQGITGYIWECPDLFELPVDGDPVNTRWVLNTSFLEHNVAGDALGACTMQYFVGTFDGISFVDENSSGTVLRSTRGPDDYAAVTWGDVPASDGRVIWIGWMSHWGYAGHVPTSTWKGAMTVPRELKLASLEGKIRLHQTPVAELSTLRSNETHFPMSRIDDNSTMSHPVNVCSYEIIVDFDAEDASVFGVMLYTGQDDGADPNGEHVAVSYKRAEGVIQLDRSNSGITDFHPRFGDGISFPYRLNDNRIRLHIFVDKCSVEVFIDNGAEYMAALIYPTSSERTIKLFAEGGGCTVESLSFFELDRNRAKPLGYSQP